MATCKKCGGWREDSIFSRDCPACKRNTVFIDHQKQLAQQQRDLDEQIARKQTNVLHNLALEQLEEQERIAHEQMEEQQRIAFEQREEQQRIVNEQIENQERIANESHLNEIKRKLMDVAMTQVSSPKIASSQALVILRSSDVTDNIAWFWPTISSNDFLKYTYLEDIFSEIDENTDAVDFFDAIDSYVYEDFHQDVQNWLRSNADEKSAIKLSKIDEYDRALHQRDQDEENERQKRLQEQKEEKKRQAAINAELKAAQYNQDRKNSALRHISMAIIIVAVIPIAWHFLSLWISAWNHPVRMSQAGVWPLILDLAGGEITQVGEKCSVILAQAGGSSLSQGLAVWIAVILYLIGLSVGLILAWELIFDDRELWGMILAPVGAIALTIVFWSEVSSQLIHLIMIVICVICPFIPFIRGGLASLTFGIFLVYFLILPAWIVGWSVGSITGWFYKSHGAMTIPNQTTSTTLRAIKASPKPVIPYRLDLTHQTPSSAPEPVVPMAVPNQTISPDRNAARPLERVVQVAPPPLEPEIKVNGNSTDLNQFRIWTSKNGKSIYARLLDVTMGGQIVVGDQFGASIICDINALIEEDQLLIRNYAKQGLHEDDHEGADGRLSYRVMNTTDGYLNVRGGPGLKFKTKGKIMASARGIKQTGKIIHDKAEDIYWMPIRFGDIEGFVSASFLQPE
jgi:hypothetical protein